jgi:WD40 repeat protein
VGLRYSPDGKRLIAGGYPGGTVQLWDAVTGKQLTKVEVGYGYRGSVDYFFLTPDWKTLFASRSKSKYAQIEKDGKKLIRWEFEGDVLAWDVDTGTLRETFRHNPPRRFGYMTLAPDGASFLTAEELPGETERQPPRAASLWDVKAKRPQGLPECSIYYGRFSPDGKTLAAPVSDGDGYSTAIKVFDVATAKEKLSIPVAEKNAHASVWGYSPDGKLLIGNLTVYPKRRDYQNAQSCLKIWDAATGAEAASFAAEEKDTALIYTAFAPDGKSFAAVTSGSARPKLCLFDVPGRKLVKAVPLPVQATENERVLIREPAYSPDGRWVAVVTQLIPKDVRGSDLKEEDVPQPRVHLVDVAECVARETLVEPQGFSGAACFSPDGKTLATAGRGKILLWDMSKPPGAMAPER